MISLNLFKPINRVLFVTRDRFEYLYPKDITIKLVGEKAFGLSCLPEMWTLPFIVIAGEVFKGYNVNKPDDVLSASLLSIIKDALSSICINDKQQIIIRSSGCFEGMNERGRMHSCVGSVALIDNVLIDCLSKIAYDDDITEKYMPLIIQKMPSLVSIKGHLSNETRLSKEKRDWIGEREQVSSLGDNVIRINLRNWRHKINAGSYGNKELSCNLSPHISEVLKIPAAWATQQGLRIHYEWVWDGEFVYLVQADQEKKVEGVNPKDIYISFRENAKYEPLCLRFIDDKCKKYSKINNVFIYRKLGFLELPLYVLDDENIINDLARGKVSDDLRKDISVLVKGSLVIRMDIDSDDLEIKQLLPRTHEVRSVSLAIDWLIEKSNEVKRKSSDDVIFIFHNFIPAVASAFAFAAPGQRKVQIESLWGLPEGLYYNSHDKYIVDTKIARFNDVGKVNLKDFTVQKNINYKHYFVRPDESGEWRTEVVKSPYDWSPTITSQQWIKKIAYDSRSIAEEECAPLSIMWFVDVPEHICNSRVIPWYHEQCDLSGNSRAKINRKKKPFDQSIVIQNTEDIERLEKEIKDHRSFVKRIRILPKEEKLLRDKNTLRRIGELCKENDAIILLEGGILSHAYYQLMQVNAIVEIIHPFIDKEEVNEYDKLVRDNIVRNIVNNGESVDYIRLKGENLLKALKNKLIEESFEVLDASDQDSIISEIADVEEVISSILKSLDVTPQVLEKVKKKKKDFAGGFEEGFVLTKTKNLIPTKKTSGDDLFLFDRNKSNENDVSFSYLQDKIERLGKRIDRWTDKKKYQNVMEGLLHASIPAILDNWSIKSAELYLDKDKSTSVIVELNGRRNKSRIEVDVSTYLIEKDQDINEKQLSLFP